jgi:hypothetical protein
MRALFVPILLLIALPHDALRAEPADPHAVTCEDRCALQHGTGSPTLSKCREQCAIARNKHPSEELKKALGTFDGAPLGSIFGASAVSCSDECAREHKGHRVEIRQCKRGCDPYDPATTLAEHCRVMTFGNSLKRKGEWKNTSFRACLDNAETSFERQMREAPPGLGMASSHGDGKPIGLGGLGKAPPRTDPSDGGSPQR